MSSLVEFAKRALGSSNQASLAFTYNAKDSDRIDNNPSSMWTMYRGTKRDDGSPVTVFVFDINRSKGQLQAARNVLKRSRTLRHPVALKFIDGSETDSQIVIGTEPVETFQSWLSSSASSPTEMGRSAGRQELTPSQKPMLNWGLYNIATLVKFLNSECSLVHGCVRLDSIYVTRGGELRLWGFELLCNPNEPTSSSHIALWAGSLPNTNRYWPPEVSRGGWDVIRGSNAAAIDSWGVGCLIHEMFNGELFRIEEMGMKRNIPEDLYPSFKLLVSPDPRQRMSCADFIARNSQHGGYFKNDFISLNLFLEQMPMKDATEKEQFIRNISSQIDGLPSDFCKHKILPELLKAMEYGGASSKTLDPILKIGAKLSDGEFAASISPIIVKLFGSPDRGIRLVLLESIGIYASKLSDSVVRDKIFTNLANGFIDTNATIREQTLKAVLHIVEKLSERILNNELLRFMARLQTDVEPGIRTNTTICLGKISRHLNESTRQKVLIPAFARSLQDPFVPARNAGLLAFIATLDYYERNDIAGKILPCVCPLLVDSELNIRTQAAKNVEAFLARLRELVKDMSSSEMKIGEKQSAQPNVDKSADLPSSFFSAFSSVIPGGTLIAKNSPTTSSAHVAPSRTSGDYRSQPFSSPAPISASPISNSYTGMNFALNSSTFQSSPSFSSVGSMKLSSSTWKEELLRPNSSVNAYMSNAPPAYNNPTTKAPPPVAADQNDTWGDFDDFESAALPSVPDVIPPPSKFPMSNHTPLVPTVLHGNATKSSAVSKNQGWGDFAEDW